MELVGDVFDPLEKAVHQSLLLALFGVPAIPEDLWDLTALPLQHGGLGLLNPTKETSQNRGTNMMPVSKMEELTTKRGRRMNMRVRGGG
eukprot:3360311-Ditylum_brightwellii.AAC.1